MSGSDGDLVSGAGLHPQGRVPGAAESFGTLRGTVWERYGLVRELGRGSTGVVFLAREKARHRYLAVKLVPLPAAPEQRALFLQQARAAARLSHPNIVPIHAVEQVRDSVLLAMPYVEGGTLAERVRAGGPLPVGQATRVLRDAARGVGFAHDRGIIHRNLKPENIMIERGTGGVLVMDFGVGIGSDAPAPVKLPGENGHTAAANLAPELVSGGEPSEQADVYALGVIGYFAMTGAVPVAGETPPEIFETNRHVDRLPVLRVYGANRSLSYAPAVVSCLCRDPRWRLRTAQDLARLLTGDAPAQLKGREGVRVMESRETLTATESQEDCGSGRSRRPVQVVAARRADQATTVGGLDWEISCCVFATLRRSLQRGERAGDIPVAKLGSTWTGSELSRMGQHFVPRGNEIDLELPPWGATRRGLRVPGRIRRMPAALLRHAESNWLVDEPAYVGSDLPRSLPGPLLEGPQMSPKRPSGVPKTHCSTTRVLHK